MTKQNKNKKTLKSRKGSRNNLRHDGGGVLLCTAHDSGFYSTTHKSMDTIARHYIGTHRKQTYRLCNIKDYQFVCVCLFVNIVLKHCTAVETSLGWHLTAELLLTSNVLFPSEVHYCVYIFYCIMRMLQLELKPWTKIKFFVKLCENRKEIMEVLVKVLGIRLQWKYQLTNG